MIKTIGYSEDAKSLEQKELIRFFPNSKLGRGRGAWKLTSKGKAITKGL